MVGSIPHGGHTELFLRFRCLVDIKLLTQSVKGAGALGAYCCDPVPSLGARCSSVVRAFAHVQKVTGSILRDGPTELFLVQASAPQLLLCLFIIIIIIYLDFFQNKNIILYAPSHRQDSTYHGFIYTSRGELAGTRNS